MGKIDLTRSTRWSCDTILPNRKTLPAGCLNQTSGRRSETFQTELVDVVNETECPPDINPYIKKHEEQRPNEPFEKT